MNADEVARRHDESASRTEHALLRLRTDLDHAAHTFFGYSDEATRRKTVDAWMRKPAAIDWQAEIEKARRDGQLVRFGQEQADQVRLLLAEHLPS